MMFEKLHRFLQLHWKIILFGVIFEILITIGAVRLTYILSKPFCETDTITSSAIQTSTVSSFATTSTGSDTSSNSTTTRPLSTSTEPAPPFTLDCTIGFTHINGKCWFLIPIRRTREDADAVCMGYGGSTLFSIRNEQENTAALDYLSNAGVNYVWTGLICAGNTSSSCTWDMKSGSAADYDNFANGFPNETNTSCVYFITSGPDAGQWKSGSCNQTMGFMCELPPTIHDGSCDYNYNNQCYLRYNTPHNIPDAQEICKTRCANLVSISSANENRFIRSLFTTQGYVLLGAAVIYYDDIYWLDGSPAVYNYIERYQHGACLLLNVNWVYITDGAWYTERCTTPGKFLCKRPAGTVC
ncbi:C-type lectin domain-containing protein [Caenorhabditis elegans]|uniref:C-type lectin domain-containing protein n=1 Tax=Caenorhabditis elegans TaxID=6239 RepID=Q9XXJ5_CAEEL|nr:C-type lectin domain-containing protein [Caenorhabditis elegans]CAA19438.2 C-type lectin domain-containing protein [Caenorhabditis elegans]|eukprot:NP_001256727.1 C-type LECtin [Caenorhabditis elegans]